LLHETVAGTVHHELALLFDGLDRHKAHVLHDVAQLRKLACLEKILRGAAAVLNR
jgi:hypothetical protein